MKNFAKNINLLLLVPLLSFVLFNCGEEINDVSGLDRTVKLSSLDDREKLQLCAWEEEFLTKASENTECETDDENGVELVPEEKESCAVSNSFSAECDLGLREDCVKSIAKNVCSQEETAECTAYRECRNQYVEPDNSGLCDLGNNIIYCRAGVEMTSTSGEREHYWMECDSLKVDYCWAWFICHPLNCEDTTHEQLEQLCKEHGNCPKNAYAISYSSRLGILF